MKNNMRFSQKLGLAVLVTCLIAPTNTKTDFWQDVACVCGSVMAGAAVIGGVAWLLSEDDVKKIERADSEIRKADHALQKLDSIVDGVIDVCNRFQNEDRLYQTAIRCLDAGYKMSDIAREIKACRSRSVSARNAVEKVLDKIRREHSYDLSHEDRVLRDRAQRALSGLRDRLKELDACVAFLNNFGGYFKVFEKEADLRKTYLNELSVITQFGGSIYAIMDHIKPYIVNWGGKYPFIDYVNKVKRSADSLYYTKGQAKKFTTRYGYACQLEDNLRYIANAVKSSAEYQNDVYRCEQDRIAKERMRIERERMRLERQRFEQEQKRLRELRRHNLNHCCIHDFYKKECSSCIKKNNNRKLIVTVTTRTNS